MTTIRKVLAVAVAPPKERKEYGTWHDDAFRIIDLLKSTAPEHQGAIAKLYRDCPHKHSVCVKTGQHVPVSAHTVAAWAANPENKTGYVARLRYRKLIP